ncbi:LOW QUALITY PROTEIN: X-box-binding protein 1 [Aulostomus maculatus]
MVVVAAAAAGGAHKVLLISGKHTASSSGSQAGFSRPISVVLPSAANQASSDSESSSSAGPPVRKRQRLTHLSPEEKALRRKLKNRVAAQTARDRKKAKMGELEQQVLELELENQKLHIENQLLLEKTNGLLTENEELRQRLGLDTLESKEKVQVLLSSGNDTDLGIGSSESAALRLRVPPQQVQAQQFLNLKTSQWIQMVLTLQTMSLICYWAFWTSLTQSCSLSLVNRSARSRRCCWSEGGTQYLPPHLQLWGPHQLSWRLNELIHFDHIYTKPVEEVSHGQCNDSGSSADKKIDEVAFPVVEVVVEDETVCIKDEPEEVVIPRCDGHSEVDDFFSASSSPALSVLDKEACLADTYSDSGYEGSPSPFSDMSSPLCSESSWEDMFANELFPQLISV